MTKYEIDIQRDAIAVSQTQNVSWLIQCQRFWYGVSPPVNHRDKLDRNDEGASELLEWWSMSLSSIATVTWSAACGHCPYHISG